MAIFSPIERILAELCAQHGVSVASVMGKTKHRPAVRVRYLAMLRAYEETGFTLRRIARYFKCDYTLVGRAVKKMTNERDAARTQKGERHDG